MPIGPTKTKAQKQKVVHTEMHKFKEGDLHSGSKHGKVVTNPKQAVAIAMSESHQSKKMPPAKGKAPKRGHGESKPGYDRSGHFEGNPGFPKGHEGKHHMSKHTVANVGHEKRGSELNGEGPVDGNAKQPQGSPIGAGSEGAEHHMGHRSGPSHSFQPPPAHNACGYGHSIMQRKGPLRVSGHSGAHQIGKR